VNKGGVVGGVGSPIPGTPRLKTVVVDVDGAGGDIGTEEAVLLLAMPIPKKASRKEESLSTLVFSVSGRIVSSLASDRTYEGEEISLEAR
jgi:hypothetical protein